MDVFISHSWEDKETAKSLETDLADAGLSVWIDHAQLRAGDLLADKVQEGLSEAKNLVLLWSKAASECIPYPSLSLPTAGG